MRVHTSPNTLWAEKMDLLPEAQQVHAAAFSGRTVNAGRKALKTSVSQIVAKHGDFVVRLAVCHHGERNYRGLQVTRVARGEQAAQSIVILLDGEQVSPELMGQAIYILGRQK